METSKKIRRIADLTLLLVAILWGTTFAVTKDSLNYANPIYIIAIRFVVGFLLMAIIFWKKAVNIQKYELKGGALVGIILFFAFLIQVIGLRFTTASKQSFIAGIFVVIVPFLSWILYSKRPDLRTFIGAIVCFIGLSLLTIEKGFNISFGDSISIFSSFLFGAHIITNGYFAQRQDVVKLTIIQFGVVGVLASTAALIFVPLPKTMGMHGLLSILYLGVFCTGLAYFMQTLGQKYTLPTHAALILSMESVFGSILAVIMLGESVTIKMVIGCIAILASILISELK